MIKRIFTKKQVRSWKSFKRNVLQENKTLGGVLNSKAEKREFYHEIRKNRDGGVTKREMRQILGKFETGRGDHIDGKEARILAREYLGKSKYMSHDNNVGNRDYGRFSSRSSSNAIESGRGAYLNRISRFGNATGNLHN